VADNLNKLTDVSGSLCKAYTLMLDHRQPDGPLSLSLYFPKECVKWISYGCVLIVFISDQFRPLSVLSPSDLHIFRYGLQEEVTFCEVIVS